MKSKKYVIYVKKEFCDDNKKKIVKKETRKKSEITVITPENLEELLIAYAI